MKKTTIDLLRKEYEQVTGKKAAIRWNKRTLEKKIRDFQILKAADEAESFTPVHGVAAAENAEFEQLAKTDVPPFVGSVSHGPDTSAEPVQPCDGRGGPRPGAGRPSGQTNERARIERLIELEVPDLGVLMLVSGFNKAIGRATGVPFDKAGCESIALGFTKMLFYWFPSLEGGSGPVSLHIQSIGLLWTAIQNRSERINQFKEQASNGTEENQEESKEESKEAKSSKSNNVNSGRRTVKK